MRIMVSGSRDWVDVRAIREALAEYGESDVLIHGAAPGADTLAEQNWVGAVERFPADWNRYGKRAGYLRNQAMIDTRPDLCLIFLGPCSKPGCTRGGPGHGSHGASMVIMLCEKAGFPTRSSGAEPRQVVALGLRACTEDGYHLRGVG